MPIRQYFKKITKSASAMQDWTTKQAALNFGWVSPVFVHLRVENLLFWVLEGYCTDVGISFYHLFTQIDLYAQKVFVIQCISLHGILKPYLVKFVCIDSS